MDNTKLLTLLFIASSTAVTANVKKAHAPLPAVSLHSKASLNVSETVAEPFAASAEGIALTINVDVPGSLGDKILAQTTDFKDVTKLTVNGTLNEDDLYTISNRLTSLIEIDLSGTTMTVISANMFNGRKTLQKIALPSKLQTIGNQAMYGCNNLETVSFPSTLKSIGDRAFMDCNSIEEVVLPEGFSKIEAASFSGCDRLKTVSLPSTLTSVKGFMDCSALETVNLAEGITEIAQEAFYGDRALKNINLPSTLTIIGKSAFYNCTSMDKVTIPSTVIVCYNAFYGCSNLKEITCECFFPPYVYDQSPLGDVDMGGRTLYVPELSVNIYKQTKGWDVFPTIKGVDILPAIINVWKTNTLTLPDGWNEDYKPNMNLGVIYYGSSSDYGHLTVKGQATLSMTRYNMYYDDFLFNYKSYDTTTPFYTTLISNAPMRADEVALTLCNAHNAWTFFAPPFDVKIADIVSENSSWVVRTYSGENRAAGKTGQTWQDVPQNGTLQAGQGYILRSAPLDGGNSYYNYFTLKAVDNGNKNLIFSNTARSIALTDYPAEFSRNRSWNLVGNPYPCFYDSRQMEFNAPITVYNETTRSYEAYSLKDDSYILRPGEAFFVQKPVDLAAIVFPVEGRQHNRNVENKVSTRQAKGNREVFNLYLTDGKNTDKTRFVINSAASTSYDMAADAGKFMGMDKTVAQLYTLKEGTAMAINERPAGDGIIRLGFYAGVDGEYTLSMHTNASRPVILVDRQTGMETDLHAGEYSFHAVAGQTDDRFFVKLGGVTGIHENLFYEKEVSVKAENSCIVVTATGPLDVQVMSVDGKLVKRANGTVVEVLVAPGIYLVKAGGRMQKVTVTK